MTREIFINVIAGLIGSFITIAGMRLFLGAKHFGGIKKLTRLNRDCYKAGIINIFPNRKAYSQHKDHGTGADYIKKCNHELIYVGYWLASSIAMGEIIEVFKKLIIDNHIRITLVFIDPEDEETLKSCSKYLGISTQKLITRVRESLDEVIKLKSELGKDPGKLLEIKIHKVPLSASAFIIQQVNSKSSRILIDYKLYGLCRDESFGIEYQDATKEITKKAIKSYLAISNGAVEFSGGIKH